MSERIARLTMDEATRRDLLERGAQGLIGKPVSRIEGVAKVTGQARYSYDAPIPDAAYGIVLTARIARGRIERIDTEPARSAPGVIAVIVKHPLLPSDAASSGRLPRNLPQIENYGQAIGVLVAESLEAAQSAAGLVRVAYAPAAGRFEIARHLDAVEHDPPTRLRPNQHIGDLDAALAAAPVTLDATYTTPHHLPAALEAHAVIASWRDGQLEIRSSLQILKAAQAVIAASLELPVSAVRILAPFIGGGFGGKTVVGPEVILAAIAAREIGRPVKIALTRRQTAHLVHRRSETIQRVRIGCTREGSILAIGHESVVSQKGGSEFIEPVSAGSQALYAGAARRLTQSVVRLDLPLAGAVRAPGEAVGSLALEVAMDEMAETLGLDPIAFRKRNEPPRDPLTGVPFSTRRLMQCYDEGAERFGWHRRDPQPGKRREGEWLVGMGMAAAVRRNQLAESHARVRLTGEGRAIVETDMTDLGTGTYTILAQIAAEMLGLPLALVDVRLGDTDLPHGPGSGGSFGAAGSGSSVALACQDIIGQLALLMNAESNELTLRDGVATARNRRLPLAELMAGEPIEALGTILPGRNSRAVYQAAYGAQFAEVAVNALTGEVRVRRMLGVFDGGRILNARTARSQLIGGMIWGLGYALLERAMLDSRTGAFMTQDFADYLVPTHADIPQIEAHFIEEPDKHANPIGVKGVGELGISGSAAGILNAIYNACGVRVRDCPATIDRILPGLPLV